MPKTCSDMELHSQDVIEVVDFENKPPATQGGQMYAIGCNLHDMNDSKSVSEDVTVSSYIGNKTPADVITKLLTNQDSQKDNQLPEGGYDQQPLNGFIQSSFDKSDHNHIQPSTSEGDQNTTDEYSEPPIDENVQVFVDKNLAKMEEIPDKEEKQMINVEVIVNQKSQISDNGNIEALPDEIPENLIEKKKIQMVPNKNLKVLSNNISHSLNLEEQPVSGVKNHQSSVENVKVLVVPKYQKTTYKTSPNSLLEARQTFADEHKIQICHEDNFQVPPNRTIEFVSLHEQLLQSKKKQQSSNDVLQVMVPRRAFWNNEVLQDSTNETKIQICQERISQTSINKAANFANMEQETFPCCNKQHSSDGNPEVSINKKSQMPACDYNTMDEIHQYSDEENVNQVRHKDSPPAKIQFLNMRKNLFLDDDDRKSSDEDVDPVAELRKKLATVENTFQPNKEMRILKSSRRATRSPRTSADSTLIRKPVNQVVKKKQVKTRKPKDQVVQEGNGPAWVCCCRPNLKLRVDPIHKPCTISAIVVSIVCFVVVIILLT